ncbi:dihydroorotate dehydrogenase B catalytic subunit [candidate division WOR-3 bacterium JGI_Cruoil_03_51_56]|uniref:Dihydroorotate dehydrogenase n=1 Tax=candidate division WOR-3 bacterium JGI_Cruoil_03_51_56 TaxID=1973747 RepID=A0A235BYG5_UNCW3|nr:MAG: dihydroorotate dehydrogenase B catalytic subunit [candidate division WOR-3 bacterium JGI_Cruoil_03_51_56]
MKYRIKIGRTVFANPVLAASGTFGFGLKFPGVANRIGGIVTKGITVEPREGSPLPRIYEFPGGILNSVGLENPGVRRFRKEILPELRRLKCRVIVNIAGFSIDEFIELVDGLDYKRVDGFELNLSCPNVKNGGVTFGQSPRMVERITKAVRKSTNKTLIVKLTGNFIDPLKTAKAAEQGGADAVCLINTLFGMALDESGRHFLGGRTGGISGPCLKPFALFCVERVASKMTIPVIGCGGIMSGMDAIDFLSAGATMVQVGTASLVNPKASLAVWQALGDWCRRHEVKDWEDIVGRTKRQD